MCMHMVPSPGAAARNFGTHSLRIGGATALFAQGADPTVIRTISQWSSDIYRLYVCTCVWSGAANGQVGSGQRW